jgi:ATP-binding cassette subfamily B protein
MATSEAIDDRAAKAANAERKVAPALIQFERDGERDISQRPLDFAIVRRLFGYTQPYARKRNALFVLTMLRAIQLPMMGWIPAAIISGPIAHHDPHGTLLGVMGFLCAVLFTDICFHFRIRLALELGESIVRDMRDEIYRHLLTMPMSFYGRTKVGRLISRVTSDVDVVRVGVQDVTFITVVQAGTMVVTGVLMIYYDWLLFLVVMTMVPVLWKLVRHFRARLSAAYRNAQESFSRVTATLAESVTGIRVTQGFVRQDINGGLFRTLIFNHSQYNMDAVRNSAVFLPMLEFNGQLFISILLVIGGYQTMHGNIGLSTLIFFFFLANYFFNAIPVLGNQYNQALSAMAGAERVFHLLDAKPDWTDAVDAKALPTLEGRVELRNVSFAYQSDKLVLSDINLVAEPGETIALVGHTGSGKTSIINLIAKFYLPTKGDLYIDGHEIRGVDGTSLHRQMGNVMQNNFLFSGTVMENIRLGRPGASDEDIVKAAHSLDVLDLIEDLPKGFATAVGEKGSGLSLGQRQVICFTRAMLANPRIIILDEATSSIDAITEARLQKALQALLAGRTSFVIAHRLSTIRHANQVLVLDHGRIVERGTHAQLLLHKGVYANLYRQFVRSGQSQVT